MVDQRPVEIGESLSEYDEVIVFIHNPSGFAAFVYNALWALSQHPNAILAFDDWQVDSIYNGLISLKDPEKLFRKYVKDTHTNIPDNVESFESVFLKSIELIESKKNRMLISAFAGGDLTKLIDYPTELLFQYNPNPFHLNRQPTTLFEIEKHRIFNFAGLVQDKTKKWLKKELGKDSSGLWPLKMYGSRKDGQDRVKESEMVNIYASQWGILMPGYFHAASGWWRARPLQVADAGSILIGEFDEMMIYYKDKDLANIRAKDLINLSDEQLAELAKVQRDALYKNHPLNKDIQIAELNRCLNKS